MAVLAMRLKRAADKRGARMFIVVSFWFDTSIIDRD